MKTAGAPISWGVCEVPGWGRQLDRSQVLAEMRELGLTATELGPQGFLPPSPSRCRSLLDGYGLRAAGGFVPVVLHDPHHDPLPEVRAAMRAFRDGEVEVVVLAASTGGESYDARPALAASGWKTLLTNLRRILKNAKEFGRTVTLHPHVGTMVENPEEVDRVLDGSAVPLCLDTGHLLIGGTDVKAGIYRPLGRGDVDVPGIVAGLGAAGYAGWYVLEQDVVLGPGDDVGPRENIRESLAYLRGLVGRRDERVPG
ncbi:sugar phosphate isomerase/epimerase family protein [Streptosporangium roseum]|uniref:sugar phosphate isomerase/epimerase family protein n=1 Tax=Streptosporangium roseum TaxID=2001 RepID=UPI0004CCC246|nr:sugar phosphate isomerase/epimerase [Streptosporangium roseum]